MRSSGRLVSGRYMLYWSVLPYHSRDSLQRQSPIDSKFQDPVNILGNWVLSDLVAVCHLMGERDLSFGECTAEGDGGSGRTIRQTLREFFRIQRRRLALEYWPAPR